MWKPIDTEFYAPRVPVSIACISSGAEQFIRNPLESLNCVVLLHRIGTPSDTVTAGKYGFRRIALALELGVIPR